MKPIELKRDFPAEHARLGPSSALRWIACPGSPGLIDAVPEQGQSAAALEGTIAHALAEHLLNDPSIYLDGVDGASVKDGAQFVYDGRPIPSEMLDLVMTFVRTVREGPGEIYTEQRIDLAPLGPPEPMFGTADAIRVNERELHVYDLKYGRAIEVGADSPQLAYYALGAALLVYIRAMGFTDAEVESAGPSYILKKALGAFDTITVTIVQPRQGNPIRTKTLQERIAPIDADAETPEVLDATIDKTDLLEFAVALMQAAERAHTPGAPLVAGEHCRFCPARAYCPALKAYSTALARTEFDTLPVVGPPAVETLPLEVAADLLTKVPVLEAWVKALRERVESALQAGVEVKGFKLVARRAHRKWIDEQEATAELVGQAGLSLREITVEPELKSPAQIEKLTGKKKFPSHLVHKPSAGLTMVPESDPRPAAGMLSAQQEFAALPPGAPDAVQA